MAIKKDLDIFLKCYVDAVFISKLLFDLYKQYKLDKLKKWVLINLATTIDYERSRFNLL